MDVSVVIAHPGNPVQQKKNCYLGGWEGEKNATSIIDPHL